MLTYCSFANEEGFLGAVALPGVLDPLTAGLECHAAEVHPGGTMMVMHFAEDYPHYDWFAKNCGRLISAEELVENTDARRLGDVLDDDQIDAAVRHFGGEFKP